MLGVVGTTAVILPAFLTGAVAVQVRADLGLDESAIGLAIGAFFAGSALGSTWLGRLAERLGPVRALAIALVAVIVADLGVVAVVDDGTGLAGFLALAGLGNALGQPAINLLVVRTVDGHRLGLVMALKQSGMPTAALLGGLAVPAIALTVGWRATFGIAAGLALITLLLLRSSDPASAGAAGRMPADPTDGGATISGGAARPDQGPLALSLMALVGVLGGGAANIVVGYLVSGAVDADIAPGPAGLLLTVGSALGVGSRLAHGWLVDRGRVDALPRVMVLLAIGLAGALGLAAHQPAAYLLATPLVFAGGWAWPGLFNLVVVQANRSAPAAATGVTQTGVYVGSVIGPIGAGALIERAGYPAAWLMAAVALGGAAAATLAVRASMAEVEPSAVPR